MLLVAFSCCCFDWQFVNEPALQSMATNRPNEREIEMGRERGVVNKDREIGNAFGVNVGGQNQQGTNSSKSTKRPKCQFKHYILLSTDLCSNPNHFAWIFHSSRSLRFTRLNVSHWAIFELVHSSRLFTTIHPCSLCTHSLIIAAAVAVADVVVVVRFGHFYLLYFISCLNSLNYLLSMPLILCIEQGCCAKYVCNFSVTMIGNQQQCESKQR